MQLKLAEYHRENGKFIHFIPLGEKFMYAGDFISLNGWWEHKDPIVEHPNNTQKIFNGRFLGRTYGGGRFVLIRNGEDQVVHDNWKPCAYYITESDKTVLNLVNDAILSSQGNLVGNIHESPELWKMINKKN